MFQLSLSFLAGLLTTLSPCVLPMIPMILGSALQKNRQAPLYMALGLMIGFTVVGFILSRFGHFLGADSNHIRTASALVLLLISLSLFSQKMQDYISEKLSFLASQGAQKSSHIDESKPTGALLLGLLLGLIWSPCSGPTLGVAISLASQQGAALRSLMLMFVFSVGAAVPLLALSYGLRSFYFRHKARFLTNSNRAKKVFAVLMLITAIFILTGFDKKIESHVLSYMPEAWVDLTTRF